MKGDKLFIHYRRGKTGSTKRKLINREDFSEMGIKCPNRRCRGYIFPDRVLKRRRSDKTTKFGSCAMCETIVTIPKESGKVKKDFSRTSLLKALESNIAAYEQKLFSV